MGLDPVTEFTQNGWKGNSLRLFSPVVRLLTCGVRDAQLKTPSDREERRNLNRLCYLLGACPNRVHKIFC